MSDGPAGRGWDWLVQEAGDARFTLIGEEHGVAETAQLSAALFKALRGSGYSRMAIELSPIIAQDIEAAARRNGLQGILNFFARPDSWSPMYLREEAQFLAAVINAASKSERVLWGLCVTRCGPGTDRAILKRSMTSPHDSTSMEPTPFSHPARGTSTQGISDEQYRLIVQSIRDYAVFMLSPEGLILSWNEGARRIKGYEAPEILGRSFEIFYPQEAVADGFPKRELKEAARVGRFEDEGWRIRKDGSRFWANVVITAIRNSEGKLVGFAKVTRDLTARRQSEEQARQLAAEQAALTEAARRNEALQHLNGQLESALALAERSTRVRDDVLAIVAHDLRNPVHTILGAAGVVEIIPAGSAHDRHVHMIQRAARRMERLISDLLDVASVESGTLSVRKAPVDLTNIVSEVVELMQGQARERSIELTSDLEPGIPVIVGDHDRLMQVLSNLLGNAIKFTPEGGNIRVRVARNDDQVLVSVADTGIGISATDLPHVFDRFWRADGSSAKGAGLGLSIASGIIEAHGGKIWAESELGVGTTVTFALPVTPPQ
jgi:PAS domain S-box-containing protein